MKNYSATTASVLQCSNVPYVSVNHVDEFARPVFGRGNRPASIVENPHMLRTSGDECINEMTSDEPEAPSHKDGNVK
jgi:hypothetical protein